MFINLITYNNFGAINKALKVRLYPGTFSDTNYTQCNLADTNSE